MIQTYQHTFKDGKQISLAVDFSTNPPRMVATQDLMPNEYLEEYRKWQRDFLVPDIMRRLSAAQMESVAIIGKRVSEGGSR